MTAVNLTRLRHQIHALVAQFDSPVQFHQALQGLFSLYANYALRFGETAAARPLIPMYHLPHPVLRQLKLDLQPHITADPEKALAVADELWGDGHYEVKYTAIFILGALSLDDPQPILERVKHWLTPELDQVLKSDLLSTGTRCLQNAFPEAWKALILTLLSHTEPKQISLGIQALSAGVQQPNLSNLPAVFRLASPFIREPQSAYIRDLERLIETLAKHSPNETGYFLRQTLSLSTSPETARLIKNCLPSFPEDVRVELKSALNQAQ